MDQQLSTTEEVEPRLADYFALLRRRWWAVALAVVVVAGAAYGFSSLQTPLYNSTSQLIVKDPAAQVVFDRSGAGVAGDPKRLVETQIQIIRSRPVLELAVVKLAAEGINERFGHLGDELKVAPVPNTDLINVSATDASPSKAEAFSAAVSSAYLEYYRKQALDELQAQAGQLQQKINDLKGQVSRLDGEIADAQKAIDDEAASRRTTGPPSGPLADRLASLRNERDQARAQLALYQSKLDQVQVDSTLRSQSALLVVPAALPASPVSPRPARQAVVGVAVGLMLGVGIAFLLDYLDDSIRTRADAARVLGLPHLGFIPRIDDWGRKDEPRVVLEDHPHSPAAEAFRTLRTNVRFAAMTEDAAVVMVTSPGADEGKTFISVNLAAVAAEAGQRTILVDADLRRPRVHRFARLDNQEGLSLAILGERPLVDLLRRPRWGHASPALGVMTSGPVPPNPSELLGLRRMGDLVETLRAWAGLVVIDSAPAVPVTDAAELAAHCDAVIMVVNAGKTSRRAARAAVERLRAVDAHVIGFVLNAATPEAAELPSGYYNYSYSGSESGNGRSAGGGSPARRRASAIPQPEGSVAAGDKP